MEVKESLIIHKYAIKRPAVISIVGAFAFWAFLKAPKGDAASKIVVPITFVWPDERQSLKAKYPNFLNYVKDPETYRKWWDDVVK